SVNAFSTGSRAVMRMSASSTTCAAPTRPAFTASAISAALAQPVSTTGSGFKDRRGLGIVRQLLLAHQRGEPERDFKIGADLSPPCGLDRDLQCRRRRLDIGVEGIG